MFVFFPQWQGSGKGDAMERGASTLKSFLQSDFIEVPLSKTKLEQKHHINAHTALLEQLSDFKTLLQKEQPKTIKTVGGDCGLEIIPVSYLASKYENLGVIWFDAHADFNTPEESPSCNFHGMPLRTMIGEGDSDFKSLLFTEIEPSQIHYIGLRSVDKTERHAIENYNIFDGFKPEVEEFIKTLKDKEITNLYIHFDVDCLDPNEFASSYYQVKNGLSIADAITYLEVLNSNFNIVGTSLLETVATNTSELEPLRGIINRLFN